MWAKRWWQNLLGLAWHRAQLQLLSPTVPLRSCDVSELSLDTQLPQREERPFRETGEMEAALALPSILQVRGGSIRAQERRGVNVLGDLRSVPSPSGSPFLLRRGEGIWILGLGEIPSRPAASS